MERAEKVGIGVAGLGHVLLFAALSLGLLTTSKPKEIKTDALDVTLTDEIGLVSSATERAIDPPAPSEAPEQGKPEEAAPPEPSPAPPEPVPPRPAPPEPTPAPPAPKPKPAPPKPTPVPKPTPRPAPKPTPAKPIPPKAEAKPTPAKPVPAKAAPAKAAPSKPAPSASTAKPSAKPGEGAGAGTKPKPTGSRLGKDFLKGIADTPSPSKSTTPRAATVGAREMAGLAALLLQQVKPCYNPPAGGADAGQIATVLNLRMKPDGQVASVEIGEQTGVSSQNAAYAKQMADAARRAVLRCAPFKLPAELYEGGWDDFGFRFRP